MGFILVAEDEITVEQLQKVFWFNMIDFMSLSASKKTLPYTIRLQVVENMKVSTKDHIFG